VDWIFEHIQFIAIVAGVIAYWVNQRRRAKEGESADYDGDGIPDIAERRKSAERTRQDPGQAERERQIREEMRRRIAERRGEGPPPLLPSTSSESSRPAAGHLDAPRPVSQSPIEEMLRRAAEALRSREEAERAEAAAAEKAERRRLRQLRDQAAALEKERQQELARAAEIARAQAPAVESLRGDAARESLLRDLRGAENLRRAFVLREVMGPPVGLSGR